MESNDLVSLSGILALEISPDQAPSHLSLERDEAQVLAGLMADDLRQFLPDIQTGKFVVVGAHFDSVEILRPDFPIYKALDELGARAQGEVVSFGTRDGHMPAEPLVPDPELAGGVLRMVPWTILLSPEMAEKVGPEMEVELVGRGEAGERTADYLMRQLGVRLEHARYFSRHDMMALVCVHYEHVNLAPLWQLIETALLRSGNAEKVMTAHGLDWQWDGHKMQAKTPGQWLADHELTADADLAHSLAGIVFELRQYVALMAAHHFPVTFSFGQYEEKLDCLIEMPEASVETSTPLVLYAHKAPGLGVIALTVVSFTGAAVEEHAVAWLLSSRLEAVCQHLADTFGCPATPVYVDKLQLTEDRQLAVPDSVQAE